MVMRAYRYILLLCVLVLAPVLAFAADCCDCEASATPTEYTANAVDGNMSARMAGINDQLRAYSRQDGSDHVYGAIAYEMRYMNQAGRTDFDQRMRFAVHYFSQLSDELLVNVGISDYIGYLPHMDPFGFDEDLDRRKQDLRLDTAYVKYSNEPDLSSVNSHLFD